MLVKVKSETGGPITVPYSPLVGQDPNAVSGKMVILVDGWNDIPFDVWPHVENNMEDGYSSGKFEYRCKTGEETVNGELKQVRIQQALQDIRADLARSVIAGCFNPFTLKTWSNDPKLSGELRSLCDIALRDISNLGKD